MFRIFFICFTIFLSSPNMISYFDLYEKLESDESIYLLDVRLYEEYKNERISNSIWAGEINELEKIIPDIPKQSIIIIYCDYENRSKIVHKILRKKKYKNLYIVSGGFNGWKNEGFPVETAVIDY